MKKSRILTLVLSIALVAVMVVTLFACGEKCTSHVDENNDFKCDNCDEAMPNKDNGGSNTNDGKEDYTFTLRDSDLEPVAGAKIKVNVNGADGEEKFTDENGVVVFRVQKGAKFVGVTIVEVPADYVIDEEFHIFESGRTLSTNTVSKKKIYTVKVVDQNGDVVAGVQVQLCHDGGCLAKAYTDAEGKAKYSVTEALTEPYASINSVPTGYALQEGDIFNTDGITYTHYTYINSSGEIEVQIVKQNTVTVKVGDFFHGNAPLKNIAIDLYDAETSTLLDTVITGADGKAIFVIEKEISYKVGKDTIYNYYIVARHNENDPRFTWSYREDGKMNAYSKEFSTDFYVLDKVTYTINVTRTNENLSLENVRVVLLNRLFEEVATANTNANGVATLTSVPYDVYYVRLENLGDSVSPLYKIAKDGNITHSINVDDSAVLGSKETPMDLVYGFNTLPTLRLNETLYCRIVNPQGASLEIEGALVNVFNEDGFQLGALGTEDTIIKIEALENLEGKYWGASITLEGTSGNNTLIKESEIGEEVSVNLINGRHYFTFEADESSATLNLLASGDVKFEVEGVITSKAVLAKGDTINFAVIGEGNVSFNLDYTPVYYDYVVNVTKEIIGFESEAIKGIEVDLIYDGVVVATGTTNSKGNVTFKDVQEYPIDRIKADVKVENLPENYVKFYGNATGAYFGLQPYNTDDDEEPEYSQYEAGYVLSLDRNGSQELLYAWAKEGQNNAPASVVKVSSTGVAYVEAMWSSKNITSGVAPAFYYVYVAGNYELSYCAYNLKLNNYNFANPQRVSTYDETKNASVLQVPLDIRVAIKVSAPMGDIKLRWGSEVLDLTAGDPVASGTAENPFDLVFSQTITTPDFVQGTSLADPGIYAYYYTYTASIDMGIQILNNNAVISVFVNGFYTDISSGVFEVKTGDVISIVVESQDMEASLDGVSFAVKGV